MVRGELFENVGDHSVGRLQALDGLGLDLATAFSVDNQHNTGLTRCYRHRCDGHRVHEAEAGVSEVIVRTGRRESEPIVHRTRHTRLEMML